MSVDLIPLFRVAMKDTVGASLQATLMSGFIGQGPRVEEFEAALGRFLDVEEPVTVNSGTSALQLALRLAGVRSGDEVISTPMTCVATNMAILAAGARIVWADINPGTGHIDPEDVVRKISPRTRAIMCVHWAGLPCDLDTLATIGRDFRIKVIEDAAHAFGARFQGARLGRHSDFVCYSFQAIKLLTTGDGGLLLCKSPEDTARARLLRWYGIDRAAPRRDFRCEEDISEWGYKFHMNDIAATIGLELLGSVEENLRRHQQNALFYRQDLMGSDGIDLLEELADRESSHWIYTLRVSDSMRFIERMRERGVMASRVHARNDRHTAFADFHCPLPGVDAFDAHQVSIPVGWWLTDSERHHIAESARICAKA